jgi:hypothetical protein
VVAIDYYRKRAKAQPDCQGWKTGIIIQKNGEMIYREGTILLDGEVLLGGWFEGTPKGWTVAMKKDVNLKRYIKKTQAGQVTRFWSEDNQPEQIAKVAESQGLRAAWPDEFQGLYVDAERQSELAQDKLDKAVETSATVPVDLEKTLGKPEGGATDPETEEKTKLKVDDIYALFPEGVSNKDRDEFIKSHRKGERLNQSEMQNNVKNFDVYYAYWNKEGEPETEGKSEEKQACEVHQMTRIETPEGHFFECKLCGKKEAIEGKTEATEKMPEPEKTGPVDEEGAERAKVIKLIKEYPIDTQFRAKAIMSIPTAPGFSPPSLDGCNLLLEECAKITSKG